MALEKLRRIEWAEGAQVFARHHPLVEIEGAPVVGGVRRGARAATLLSQAGVEPALTECPCALCRASQPGSPGCYAIGAGTLSGAREPFR
jgi:hypothetical protein